MRSPLHVRGEWRARLPFRTFASIHHHLVSRGVPEHFSLLSQQGTGTFCFSHGNWNVPVTIRCLGVVCVDMCGQRKTSSCSCPRQGLTVNSKHLKELHCWSDFVAKQFSRLRHQCASKISFCVPRNQHSEACGVTSIVKQASGRVTCQLCNASFRTRSAAKQHRG